MNKKNKHLQLDKNFYYLLKDKQVEDFLKILNTINNFSLNSYNNKTIPLDVQFRLDIVKENPENLIIKCKYIQNYDFLIYAKIISSDRESTWLHVDGIQEERQNLNQNHPVFLINCLVDIIDPTQKTTHIEKQVTQWYNTNLNILQKYQEA